MLANTIETTFVFCVCDINTKPMDKDSFTKENRKPGRLFNVKLNGLLDRHKRHSQPAECTKLAMLETKLFSAAWISAAVDKSNSSPKE